MDRHRAGGDGVALYELALIPGLFQTEEYARAQFEGDEAKLATRMERQTILVCDAPPQPVALVHEVALRQRVGGADVMQRQFRRLAEAADRHLFPGCPGRRGSPRCIWDGPFVLATVDGSDTVYLPTARGDGYIFDARTQWRRYSGARTPSGWRPCPNSSQDFILELTGSGA